MRHTARVIGIGGQAAKPGALTPPVGGRAREANPARVAQLLRLMRRSARLPQRGLARRLGKPQSTIHSCERNDRRVDVVEFVAWARACGHDPVRAVAALLAEEAPSSADELADLPAVPGADGAGQASAS